MSNDEIISELETHIELSEKVLRKKDTPDVSYVVGFLLMNQQTMMKSLVALMKKASLKW